MNKFILVIATLMGSTAFLPVASAVAAGTTPTATPTATKTPTPTPTVAANCQPIYGGGTTCETTELVLDKTVQHPKTGVYVDNTGVNDPKYGPDGTVRFKLTVRNTGTTTFDKVTVTDTLPDYIAFTEGDAKTHTFTLDNLKPNESRTIDLSAKIVSTNALPNDKGITCVTNAAKATAGDQSASDTAQFCIEKNVLSTKGGLPVYPTPSVTTTPPTGPEALALAGLVPSSVLGFFLRRKTSVK
jgi:uncharacterized repeat protein (TIGR01451 family)